MSNGFLARIPGMRGLRHLTTAAMLLSASATVGCHKQPPTETVLNGDNLTLTKSMIGRIAKRLNPNLPGMPECAIQNPGSISTSANAVSKEIAKEVVDQHLIGLSPGHREAVIIAVAEELKNYNLPTSQTLPEDFKKIDDYCKPANPDFPNFTLPLTLTRLKAIAAENKFPPVASLVAPVIAPFAPDAGAPAGYPAAVSSALVAGSACPKGADLSPAHYVVATVDPDKITAGAKGVKVVLTPKTEADAGPFLSGLPSPNLTLSSANNKITLANPADPQNLAKKIPCRLCLSMEDGRIILYLDINSKEPEKDVTVTLKDGPKELVIFKLEIKPAAVGGGAPAPAGDDGLGVKGGNL